MGRCPWHGEVCNCGLGWPFPVNGKRPERCQDRTPGHDPLADDVEYTVTRKGDEHLRKSRKKPTGK